MYTICILFVKTSAFYSFVVWKLKIYISIYSVAQVLVPYRFCTKGKQNPCFVHFIS